MSKNIDTSSSESTHKDLILDLERLGLSNKEARIYLALLNLGEVGASKIIKSTELHGQFVYNTLDTLEGRGLVQHSIVRGRKKFTAKSPDTLIILIDQQKRCAEMVSKKLKKMQGANPLQQFDVYQGQEMFVRNEFELLKTSPVDSEILIIGGNGDKYRENHGKFFESYEYARKKKNVVVRYVGSEEQRHFLRHSQENRELFKYHLLPGAFGGEFTTTIFEDRINFYMFSEPIVVFSLKNKKIAESYRGFFETLWKLAK